MCARSIDFLQTGGYIQMPAWNVAHQCYQIYNNTFFWGTTMWRTCFNITKVISHFKDKRYTHHVAKPYRLHCWEKKKFIRIYRQKESRQTRKQGQSKLSLITNYWNVCIFKFRYYCEKYLRLRSSGELIAFAMLTVLFWILIKGEDGF
jgi:hypothetical protein